MKAVKKGKSAVEAKRQNDPKRFIKVDHATVDGEVADKAAYYVDLEAVNEKSQYDGFYAVRTNLNDEAQSIVKINKGITWEQVLQLAQEQIQNSRKQLQYISIATLTLPQKDF